MNKEKYRYYFNAILCDRFCCNFIKGCDLGIDNYGIAITISFITDIKPIKRNITKIETILNSTKNEKSLDTYYVNTKFEKVEYLVKEN